MRRTIKSQLGLATFMGNVADGLVHPFRKATRILVFWT